RGVVWVEDVRVAGCSRPAEFISTPRKLLEPWDGGVRGAVCASLLWVRAADIMDRPIFPRTLPDCWLALLGGVCLW
ncbi:hypothetical protein ASPBRDRAFT_117507, partial [Aspergillus brasiliensis CBS 101740]